MIGEENTKCIITSKNFSRLLIGKNELMAGITTGGLKTLIMLYKSTYLFAYITVV